MRGKNKRTGLVCQWNNDRRCRVMMEDVGVLVPPTREIGVPPSSAVGDEVAAVSENEVGKCIERR